MSVYDTGALALIYLPLILCVYWAVKAELRERGVSVRLRGRKTEGRQP